MPVVAKSHLPGASRSSPLTRHFVMVITSVLVSTAMVDECEKEV